MLTCKTLPLRRAAPLASKWTAFQKNRRPYAWTVMDRKMRYIKNPASKIHTITAQNIGTTSGTITLI